VKVRVSKELCTGHGRCYALAPTVYSADDEGYNAAAGSEIDVPAGQEQLASRGVRGCPEHAIHIVQEEA
jgi:ferredoxin